MPKWEYMPSQLKERVFYVKYIAYEIILQNDIINEKGKYICCGKLYVYKS